MKFEIPFDESIYKQQIELTFKQSWLHSQAETKKLAIIAIVFVCLGIAILYGDGDIGKLFLIIGIISLAVFAYRLKRYKKAKNTTQNLMIEAIKVWKTNPISLWEFENDFFRFKFYGGDYKINWDTIKHFEVVENTLFFGFKKNGNYYTLSESEVGKDDFLRIVEFVKQKIEPATNTRYNGFGQLA